MQRNAIIPTADTTIETVSIPVLRTLVVKRFTSEETGEFLAPVSDTVVVAKAENTVESSAKTVRPAKRGRA